MCITWPWTSSRSPTNWSSTFLADVAILLTSLAVPRASIVLNLAEGAGKFSKPDKRRYYLIAQGSTTECAAILDVCLRLKLVLTEPHSVGKAMLERIAAMLVKLAKAQEG